MKDIPDKNFVESQRKKLKQENGTLWEKSDDLRVFGFGPWSSFLCS